MIHYSCIGATGYVCGEVLRMMVNHHEGELVNVLDTYGVGDAISTHHPALRGFYDQVIMDLTEENVRETAKKSDVIMIQVPSGDVAKWAEIVLAEDCAIIDIGADIRFRDVDVWEKWYGQKHPDAKMTHDAVYCIPEVMRDLAKGKKLIANPGCYPTASTLGLQPMLKAGHIVDNTIVIDAKSGYTGAGRRPALNKLLTEAENNFCAYALGRRPPPHARDRAEHRLHHWQGSDEARDLAVHQLPAAPPAPGPWYRGHHLRYLRQRLHQRGSLRALQGLLQE